MEVFVVRVVEEPVGEREDDGLDGGAEAVADAGAGIERVLVVDLDGGLAGGVLPHREAGRVEKPVEEGEVGEEFLGEDAFEVELDEREVDEPGGIAQEAEQAAVRDDPVEVLGEVEVFLHEAVGRHAGCTGSRAPAVE